MDDLRSSRDSSRMALKSMAKELGVKDNKINALMSIKSHASKIDSFIYTDTLFVDSVNIDTLLGDK